MNKLKNGTIAVGAPGSKMRVKCEHEDAMREPGRSFHYSVDHPDFRITVEELSAFKFISTYWDKRTENQYDRSVREFESYGGAVGDALERLSRALKLSIYVGSIE